MQNADREAVKPTTTAVLNNSHRTAVHHAMGLGVSSSGVGDIGFSQSSGSSTESDRVGRFQRQNMSDDHSDSEDEKNADSVWKFEKAHHERQAHRRAKSRLKLNLIKRGSSPQIDDEDDAFRNKSSELTRMISDDDDDDNDPNDDDQSILLGKAGDMEAIHQILKQSSDTNGTREGDSYLCLAAAAGLFDLCQTLLAHGASVDDRGHKSDCTPLMEAASAGYKRVVQLFCEKGADVNAKSLSGNTPLHFASCNGNDEVIRVLLDFGASLEDHNDDGHNALMAATNSGHISTVQLLLSAGASINAHSNEFKETALTVAAYKGHFEIVDFLLVNGADVDHKTDEMHTALMEAAMEGHVNVARRLIDAGAKVNMPEDSFESPLTLAASGGYTELAELLISSGASIEEAVNEGFTPLIEAVREGQQTVAQLLLNEGANPNVETHKHETPLGFACKAGYTEIAAHLISHGAVVDQEGEDGHTPLMKAAKNGHLSTVQHLISVGADINKLSCNNESSLSLACSSGCTSIVEFLLKNGANPVHRLQEGSTVIIEAAKGGHLDVVNLLLTYTNSIRYQQMVQEEQELSQSSPSQTSLDDQTSRVPIQGLGNVVPPQDPAFAGTGLQDNQQNFSRMEQQYAGGDRRMEGCQHAVGDKVCSYHLGLGDYCGSKSVLRSPQGSGCSSSDEDDDDEDEDDYEDDEDEDENGDGELSNRELQPKGLIEIKGTVKMSSAEFPPSLKKMMLDGFPNVSLAEQMQSKQLLFEKCPSLLKNEQIDLLLRHELIKQPNRNHQFSAAFASSSDNLAKRVAESPQKQMQNGFALMSGDQKLGTKQASGVSRADQKMAPHGASCECPHKSISPESIVSQLAKKKNQSQLTPGARMAGLNQWPGDDDLSLAKGKSQLLLGHGTGTRPPPMQNRVIAKAQRKLLKQEHSSPQQFPCSSVQDSLIHPNIGSLACPNLSLQQPLSVDLGSQKLPDDLVSHFGSASIAGQNSCGQYNQIFKNFPESYQQDLLRQMQQQQLHSHQMLVAGDSIPITASPTYESIVLNSDMAARPGSLDKCAQTMLSQCQSQHLLSQQHQQQFLELSHASDGRGCGVFDLPDAASSRPLSPSSSLTVVPGFNPLTEMVDVQTEVSHDSALSVACAGGHRELASLLLSKGAKIELRDKKGLTPLLLAASANHAPVVELLLDNKAEIEAQSDRTKDTALSLACAGGRYEVVELLLKRGANKEHRNVSDYTPLSQAASGGYIEIIRLLLSYNAEINSRTGSKLGISPLMLAAMNGHTESVILLLDNGSDINAHIETNRNTALTLACFQGRHEVVAVLADRKANLEHRAKTGLTPLMEAATGGYVEVGRVLLEKGADVAAAPVPTSRDTALTIAADKGHFRFVELLLKHNAPYDVKNKKGATALWLACNGGHLEVVQLLVRAGADVDSQDNRKVSCLVTAFRKGHTRVIKWIVKHVTQFPADQECARYIASVSDPELLVKCKECSEIILSAKELQAEEAEKNADSLLQELQQEKSLVEKKRAAKERKREKKRQKKKEKTIVMKDSLKLIGDLECGIKNNMDCVDGKEDDLSDDGKKESNDLAEEKNGASKKDGNKKISKARKTKSRSSVEDDADVAAGSTETMTQPVGSSSVPANLLASADASGKSKISSAISTNPPLPQLPAAISSQSFASVANPNTKKDPVKTAKGFAVTGIGDLDDFCNPDDVKISAMPNSTPAPQPVLTARSEPKAALGVPVVKTRQSVQSSAISLSKTTRVGAAVNVARTSGSSTQKKGQRRDEAWKDASKKMRKIDVPARAVSRVIGRAGCNINAIREHTSARIDLDKLKTSDDAVVTIRGLTEQINQAAELVLGLIRESDKDIDQLIAGLKAPNGTGQAMPSGTWKSSSKAAGASSTSVWDSGTMNVWENRSMKGGNVGTTPGAAASAVDGKSTNVWNRMTKETTTHSDLNISSSNVWDNSMADGIGVGANAVGSKASAAVGGIGSGKVSSQLGKPDGLDQQRHGTTDDYIRPQLIRSFPIGAWTPVRGGSGSSMSAASERVIPLLSQQNPNLEATTSTSINMANEAGSFSSIVVETVNGGSDNSVFEGDVKAVPVLFSRTESVDARVDGRVGDTSDPCPMPSLASSFQSSVQGPEKLRQQLMEMSIGEYMPFNNHFSPLAESVIPKKPQSGNHVKYCDMLTNAPKPGALSNDIDMALQAKAPGFRPPGQVQRSVSSPDPGAFQGEPKTPSVNENDRLNVATPPFNHTKDQSHSPNIGDYSPFSEGIEKVSKLVLQMNDGFNGVFPTPTKPDPYITTQSPMMLPRVSSNLNPDAPHFSSRPALYKPQSLFDNASPSMFLPPNYRPSVNLNMMHNSAGLAAFHAANGYIPTSAVKDMMVAQSMGFSVNSIAANNVDPAMLLRRYSLDDGVQSGSQLGASAGPPPPPSVSNPPSPNDEIQSNPAVLGDAAFRLRPIGTERTNKRPQNVMPGSSAGMPTGDLQPWTLVPGSAEWQRQGYIGAAPVPLNIVPNMPQDGLIPQLSTSNHHPAMIGHMPMPQQKILAINNAMFDQSVQIRPGFMVPNGMAMPPFGGGAAMGHPSLQYPHLPPPSPASERAAMENPSNWTSASGMGMPDGVDGPCEEERLRAWNIWNGPSNL